MKGLLEVIAKSLVDNPDEVVVTEKETEKGLVLELKVGQSDRQAGTYCKSNPFCGKSRGIKRKQAG